MCDKDGVSLERPAEIDDKWKSVLQSREFHWPLYIYKVDKITLKPRKGWKYLSAVFRIRIVWQTENMGVKRVQWFS